MTAPLPTLGDLAEIQSGLTTRAAGDGEGVPVLTMASLSGVHASGCEAGSLLRAEWDGQMMAEKYRAKPLDILIPARTTPGYLRPVLLGEEFGESLPYNSTLLRIRVNPEALDPWWLLGYLRSPLGIKELLDRSQSGTAQLNLNASLLKKLGLPLPSMPEQWKIGELIRLADLAHHRALEAADLRLKLAHGIAFQSRH